LTRAEPLLPASPVLALTHPGPSAGEITAAHLPNVVAAAPEIRPLTEQTLGQHRHQLMVPTYDRSALTPAVVHFSVGGFHRSHQLLYFDESPSAGSATAGGSSAWACTAAT